jgi:hypothetical protein
MEKEHLIIIAILAVILYMCMNKTEKFYGLQASEASEGTLFAQNIRRGVELPGGIPDAERAFAQRIRRGVEVDGQDIGGFAQNIRRGTAQTCVDIGGGQQMCQQQGGFDSFAQRVRRNDMNIMGSQFVTNHIRRDHRNSMLSNLMQSDSNTGDMSGAY